MASLTAISTTEIPIGSANSEPTTPISSSFSESTPELASEISLSSTQITGPTQITTDNTGGLPTQPTLISSTETEGTLDQRTGSSESPTQQENPSSFSSISMSPGPSESSSENTAITTPISPSSYEQSINTVTTGATDTISSSLTDAGSSSSTISSFSPTSFDISAPSLSSSSNDLSSSSISEPPTIESTARTSGSTTITTNATTTTSNAVVPIQPISVVYQVSQTINSTSVQNDLGTPEGQKDFFRSLNEQLAPELTITDYNASSCPGINCTISYSVSYRGYRNQNTTTIEKYIMDRTSKFSSSTIVINVSSNDNKIYFNSISLNFLLFIDKHCFNEQNYRQQDDCAYCATENACAELPESTCILPENNDQSYSCKYVSLSLTKKSILFFFIFIDRCDLTKYFFRTNYEYDGRCGRNAILWWPQMLVICLLVFIIFLLVLALILFCRRRQRIISKR